MSTSSGRLIPSSPTNHETERPPTSSHSYRDWKAIVPPVSAFPPASNADQR